MNCRQTQFLWNDYLSGDLPPEDKLRLEEHLKKCPSCREFTEEEKKLSALLRGFPVADPGEPYWQSLESSILSKTTANEANQNQHAEYAPAHSFRTVTRLLLPAAAAIILLLVSLSLIGNKDIMTPSIDKWGRQYSYNSNLIGNHTYVTSISIPENLPNSGTSTSLILSSPGSAGYNLIILNQLLILGWGGE
jgi:hypothetical protein